MLKLILGKAAGSKRAKALGSDAATQQANKLVWLKSLIEFFPIGKKIRYCPEFKTEIVFNTIVVAYCVNGEALYTSEAIERDPAGNPTVFRTAKNDERTRISDVELFQLLVPDTSDLELKLDYERRALLGRGRQFIRGNCITLMSDAEGRGVSTIDTEVAKQVLPLDGPYAHTKLILLTPELDTLVVTDQRRRGRAKISVPVTVSVKGWSYAGASTIVDISDGAVRIRLPRHDATAREIQKGEDVILAINLGTAERNYTIKGVVMRRSPEICVIRLDGFFRNGVFSSFGPMDNLELKASLLNYGASEP